MTHTNNEIIVENTNIPESVQHLVEEILKVHIPSIIEDLDEYEPTQEFDFVQMEVIEYTVEKLYKNGFKDALKFLEKGSIISGLFGDEYQTVFEYDKWYINPVTLFSEESDKTALFEVKGNKPAVTFKTKTIAAIVLGLGTIDVRNVLGENLLSRKWIKRMLKKESIYSLIISILNLYILTTDLNELLNDVNYEGMLITDRQVRTNLQSLRGVNFLSKSLMDIVLNDEVFDEQVDVLTDIVISYGPSAQGIREYWIEFGEFCLITEGSIFPEIEIDLLKNFKHKKELSFTVSDVIGAKMMYQKDIQDYVAKQ